MSNVLGTYTPAARIARMAHEAGAKILFDGSQSIVHRAIDVQAMDADFFVFTGHKLYGPTGIGVLYGKAELLAAMPPFLGGGDMIASVSYDRSTWAKPPHRHRRAVGQAGFARRHAAIPGRRRHDRQRQFRTRHLGANPA
jgi:cysteine desulfurase/selenocysteine lyase